MIRISSFRGLNKNNVLRKLYSVIAVTGTNTLIKPKFPHFFVLFLILCYGGGGKNIFEEGCKCIRRKNIDKRCGSMEYKTIDNNQSY